MTTFSFDEALKPSTYPGATPQLSDEMDSLQKAGQMFDIKVDDWGNKIKPKKTFSFEDAVGQPSPAAKAYEPPVDQDEWGMLRTQAAEPKVERARIPGSVMDGSVIPPAKPENRAPYSPEFLKQREQDLYNNNAAYLQGTMSKSTFDFDTADEYDQKNMLTRGARRMSLGSAQFVAGMGQFIADAYGADEAAKFFKDQNEAFNTKSTAIESGLAKRPYWQQQMEGAISSSLQNVPTLAAGIFTGAEAPALLYMGLQSFGQEYSNGDQANLSFAERSARAAIYGAFEIIGEKIGMPSFMDSVKAITRGMPARDMIKSVLAHGAKEVVGEEFTTTGEFLTDKLAPFGLTPNATAKDYVQAVADTLVQTAMQTGMMGAGGSAINAAVRAQQNSPKAKADLTRAWALNKWETEGFHQTPPAAPPANPAAPPANPVDRLRNKPSPAEIADPIVNAPSLDAALDTAMATTRTPITITDQGEVYNPDAPIVPMADQLAAVEARAAPQGEPNEHQAALNDALGTVGPDGIALHNGTPVRAVEIDSMPDAADSAAAQGRTTRQGAQAIRDLASKAGTEVTFFADDPKLPDGFVDPNNPNRIFVSDNPQRGMVFTANHEFKHTTENITLPDGSTLNDQLVEAVHRGMTPEGRAYAFERFRSSLPAGATQQQTEEHFANELSADIGGWALLRKDFLSKMFTEIETRHGEGVVKSVMTKFLNGITDTIRTIKSLFKGQPSQQDLSTRVVSNLEEVHGILAKMYADKFGGVAAENLKLESERVASQTTKTTESTGPPKAVWTAEQDRVLNEKLRAANEAAKTASNETELAAAEKLANEAEDMRMEKMASMGQETELDVAAHEAATSPLNDLPQPTDAQKEAGNYKVGRVNFQGLPISIENPVGSVRSGVSANGNKWSTVMKSHYGYIRQSEGSDGDHVDAFIGPNHESQKVFVVDQRKANGQHDEHKVMLGFDNIEAAKQGYLENYTKGWKGMGAITPTTMNDFKSWLVNGDTTKPFASRLQYSPKSYQQSAIKILEGEDAKTPMTISEVAQYFDKLHGPAADFTDQKAQERAYQQALTEFAHQIKSQHTGLDWYDGDIEQAFKITSEIIPYLAEGRQRMLFSVVAGIHSQQTKVVQNWPDAAESYQHYLRDGEFPPMNPNNGNYWATSSGPNKARHIGMVNNMIRDLGEDGFIDYMFTLHTTRELNEGRRRWGGFTEGIAGKMNDEQLGVSMFGPKVSEFIKNINGLDGVTVDKWMTRTFHRWFGRMADANGEIVDAPTEPERRVIKLIVNKIAVQYGTSPQSVQAALWYFEQGVFKKLGAGGDARGFSEAAKEFYQRETGNEYAGNRQGRSGDREAGRGSEEDLQFSPKVVFEVAPNPNDKTLTDRWEALSPAQRIGISERVARTVIPDYLASIGATGEIMSQVGSYEDKTNRSFLLVVDGADPVRVAKTLGYALSQDSVIVMSDEPFEGGERRGAVTVAMGDKTADEVNAIYQKLHAANPDAIGGQSYSDGVMTILNFSDLSDEELAKVVADGLNDLEGHYEISHHEVFTSFLEGKDYDYDNQESNAGRNEEAVRLREGLVRERVSAAIEREFAAVKQSPKRPDDARGRVAGAGGAGPVQETKQGAVSGTGVHYSTAPRNTLVSSYFGTGYKGAELTRVREATDPRIQQRIYFYVNTGRGINPESGVGPHAHQAELTNVYDATADALNLWVGRDPNEFESAVLNAGFNGYMGRASGVAVMLGQRSMPVEYLGMGERPDVSPFGEARASQYRQDLRRVQENRTLPSGEMTGAEWKLLQDRVGLDLSHLDDTQRYYKNEIVPRPALQMSPKENPYQVVRREDYPDPQNYFEPGHDFGVAYNGDFMQSFKTLKQAAAYAKEEWKTFGPQLSPKQTETPQFKKWFGDSKVVDENGKPLVMYHGSGDSFSKFEGMRNKTIAGFFTPDPEMAADFADGTATAIRENDGYNDEFYPGESAGDVVYPVYLSVQNPFDPSNQTHVSMLVDSLKHSLSNSAIDELRQGIATGDYAELEEYAATIRNLGFDGYYEREHPNGLWNIAIFSPEQIKSAIGNNGQFDASNPDIRYSPKPFYSALTRAVEESKTNSAPADQWVATLNKTAGVKADEIKWSGVDDWLMQKGGKVTRQEVLDYLRANEVNVQEVMLGSEPYDSFALDDYIEELNNKYGTNVDGVVTTPGWEDSDLTDEEVTKLRKLQQVGDWASTNEPTKFSDRQLPGGENYRELLLTLPESPDKRARLQRQMDELRNGRLPENMSDDEQTKFYELLADYEGTSRKSAPFVSSHFDQPNILAHVRFNERTDAEGKRVLFIEEVQSDWAQKGRKEGFSNDGGGFTAKQVEDATPGFAPLWKVFDKNGAELGEWYGHSEREAIQGITAKAPGPVPAAPFVGNTSSWSMLAMKRMIRYAAENGFDKIAWTTGEQQAARYDLSKQISRITLKEGDGRRQDWLAAYDHNGVRVIDKMINHDELADYIGKDAAEKLLAQKPKQEIDEAYMIKEISGLDLKVGGEGMKGFYDKILPAEVNKYVKRWGTKVESTKLQTKLPGKVFQEGESLWGHNGSDLFFKSKEEAERDAKGLTDQPSVTITPQMRESAMQGQPLFSPKNLTNPNAAIPEETAAQQAQRIGQDKFNRFKIVQNWLDANGVTLSEAANVYRAEALYYGRVASRVQDFRDVRVQALIKDLEKTGHTLEEVDMALHAQHAEERNKQIAKINPQMKDGGSGMKTADARAILAKLDPELLRVANDFRAITTDTKNILLASGLIDQSMANAWDAAYKKYVPLKGGDEVVATGTGKHMDVNAKMKRAMGHSFREEHIVENIIRDHERAITLAEKNRVAQVLLQFALEADIPDLITIGQPEKRATLVSPRPVYEVRYQGGTIATLHSLQDARAEMQYHIQTTGMPAKNFAVHKVQGGPSVRYMASPMIQENEARVYLNGQMVRMQINDPLLARAYKNLGQDHLVGVLKVGREINTWLSKAYTGYNPTFLLKNIIRDAGEGVINLTGEYGAGTAARVVANYPSQFLDLLVYAKSGRASQMIRDYRADGGSTGAAYLGDLERIGDDARAAYNDYAGVLDTARRDGVSSALGVAGDKTVSALAHYIEVLNQAGENAMRLSTYKTLREAGYSRSEAALAAKDVTINFNRKGEIGQQAGALWLFFNPSVQGAARTMHTLLHSEHKAQAWALTGAMALLFYAMAAWNNDVDKKRWEETPDYDKAHNLIIPFTKYQVKIPISYGYGFFGALGTAAFDLQNGKPMKNVVWQLANAFAESFSPIGNPIGDKPDMKNAADIVPFTPLKVATQIGVNRSGLGGPIYPENQRAGKPDSATMFRNTKGSIWDWAAAAANKATGGNEAQAGWVDVHPDTIKSLWATATGGTGRFITDSAQLANVVARGATPELHEIPIARDFLREPRIGDTRKAFWDAANQVEVAQGEFATAKANMLQANKGTSPEARADAAKLKDQVLADTQAMRALGSTLAQFKRAVDAKRDAIDAIQADKSLTLNEQRLKVREMEVEEKALYDRFLAIFKNQQARSQKK